MRATRIVVVAAAVILEALVITAILQTRSTLSKGGDVVTMAADGIPVNVGGETKTFAKGTYVMTPGGLVRLRWHWVLKYAYVTVPLPMVLALLGVYVTRGSGGNTAEPARHRMTSGRS